MNPQTAHPQPTVVTLFLKPSFLVTAQSTGLQVAVRVEQPQRPSRR